MGNVVPTLLDKAQDMQVILQTEFPEYLHEAQIGKGKFMKTHTVKRVSKDTGKLAPTGPAANDEYNVRIGDKAVIKIYIKRDRIGDLPRRIQVVREQLLQICKIFDLSRMPNVIPYQRFEDSARNDAAFLIRQHFMYNLYDRMNTRPFFAPVEKKWLIFQLLHALRQIHSANVRHGDIKSENIMVTSWGWLLITDFALFKPTFIPEDHPASFYYFFEAGTRRRCYIAPERFVKERELERLITTTGIPGTAPAPTSTAAPTSSSTGAATVEPAAAPSGGSVAAGSPIYVWPCDPALTSAMDIFAAGCTISEIVLDGEPLLDLSALLRYKASTDYDPVLSDALDENFLAVDPSGQLRAMVRKMIDRDPAVRGSADEHLLRNTAAQDKSYSQGGPSLPSRSVFPAYFPFLFALLGKMVEPERQAADLRVLSVCAHYGDIVRTLTNGAMDPAGEVFMQHRLGLEPDDVRSVVDFPADHAYPKPDHMAPRLSSANLSVGSAKYSFDAGIAARETNELLWEWGFVEDDAFYMTETFMPSTKVALPSPMEHHRKWIPVVARMAQGFNNAAGSLPSHGLQSEEMSTGDSVLMRGASQLSHTTLPLLSRITALLEETVNIVASADVVPSPRELPTAATARTQSKDDVARSYEAVNADDIDGSGFIIIVSLLMSSLRHITNPRTKLTALFLTSRLAAYADDECRLQRVVPYVMTQLHDISPVVRAHAAYCITCTLECVRSFPASDALLFPQYIFQAFAKLLSDNEACVQLAAAECLPRLAICSRRFLDIAQWKSQAGALQRMLQGATAQNAVRQGSFLAMTTSSPLISSTASDATLDDGVSAFSLGSPSISIVDAASHRVRSSYDCELDSLHRRVQELVQKWVTSAGASATASVATATIDHAALSSVRTRVRSRPQLFDPAVLLKFAQAFGQFSAGTDTALSKRVLLQQASQLCNFFGRAETEGFFLPILFTFLADPIASTAVTAAGPSLVPLLLPPSVHMGLAPQRQEELIAGTFTNATLSWLSKSPIGTGDWLLKDAFLKQLVKVAALVGPHNTQSQLLPFFEQGFTDINEPVVYQAAVSIAELLQRKLLSAKLGVELLRKYACLILHPSQWIRMGAATLIASVWWSLRWPNAFAETAPVINDLLTATTGRLCWARVRRILCQKPAQAFAIIQQLTNLALECAIRPVARTSLDRECHRIVIALIKQTTPALSEVLKLALSTKPGRPDDHDAPTDVYRVSLNDLVAGGLPQYERSRSAERNDFSDAEDDDDEGSVPDTMTPDQKLTPDDLARSAASGLFDSVPFAPEAMGHAKHAQYCFEKMKTYLKAVAGPLRISVQSAMRLSFAGSHPCGADALDVADYVSGKLLPECPYSAPELADVPVHSLSIPDQRYASLYPACPRSLVGRVPNPQDESKAAGRKLSPAGQDSVFIWKDSQLPAVAVRVGYDAFAAIVDPGARKIQIQVPAWRYALHASPPLPADIVQYTTLISSKFQRADGTSAGVSVPAATLQLPLLTLQAPPASHRMPARGIAAMSPVSFLRHIRKAWRHSGRRARRAYIRHGIWDPFLVTDANSSQVATGVGTTTAFFYDKTEQEDPSMYSSDEDKQAIEERTQIDDARLGTAAIVVLPQQPMDFVPDVANVEDHHEPGDEDYIASDFAVVEDDARPPAETIFDVQRDARIAPASLAARFSSSAQSAITASDSTWLLMKLSAWASAAGVSLPPSAGPAAPSDRSGALGANTMLTAAASQRYETFTRRRNGRGVRPLLVMRPQYGNVLSELGGEFVVPSDATDSEFRRQLRDSRNPAGTQRRATPAAAVKRADASVVSNVIDGSFILRSYEAETTVQKAHVSGLAKLRKGPAEKPAELTIIPQYSPTDTDKPSKRASNASRSGQHGRDNRDFLSPENADSLQRRIEALEVPPLPPNLGFLSKPSDPPAPIVSHAVRVAVGISAPDSASSVAPGVGGGGLGQLSNAAPPRFAIALDESVTSNLQDGATANDMPREPIRRVPSQTNSDDGFEIITVSGESAASSSIRPNFEVGMDIAPVLLPMPLTEDILRPSDVGDGTGYVGSGRLSFIGVERGWRDALGLSGPQNVATTEAEKVEAKFTVLVGNEAARGVPEPQVDPKASNASGAQWDGGDGSWGSRPKGLLLSTLYEHTAAINSISACQDHSFFVSASDDGTVKIWDTKSIGRSVVPSSLLTYTGHLQESRVVDKVRKIRPGKIRVTDAIVCDNSCSVASGSSAGTVHVFRLDIAAARSAPRPSAGHVQLPEYLSPSGSFIDDIDNRKNVRGSFIGARPSRSDTVSESSHAVDDEPEAQAHIARSHLRLPECVALIRRLAYDAEEGSIVAVRNYQNSCQNILAIATEGGVLHGCDLRARSEAWAYKVPSVFGTITCMELCPGSTSCVIGTDRGVVVLFDTRFNIVVAAWRHSARSAINALYPYVSLDVRHCNPSPYAPLFSLEPVHAGTKIMPLARQLAVGIATGQSELSFWNLETGACTRILRSLPEQVHAGDAYRLPYLTRITMIGGNVSVADTQALHTPVPSCAMLVAASKELLGKPPAAKPVRAILCPLPSSLQPILGGAQTDESAAAALRPEGFGAASSSPGAGFVLGGLRGAGATRRKEQPFAVGYAVGRGRLGAEALAHDAVPDEDVGYVYGGSPLEGLPVWMLTAGDDRTVRCWDLDRPRASHTVVGLRPGEVRDAYEGAVVLPMQPDEFTPPASPTPTSLPEIAARKAANFPTYSDSDAMSIPDSRAPRQVNPYQHQGNKPIRAILSQTLYDPTKEADVMGSGGASAHPSLLLRGPVPSYAGHDSSISAMAWIDCPTRLLLTGSSDGIIKIWR